MNTLRYKESFSHEQKSYVGFSSEDPIVEILHKLKFEILQDLNCLESNQYTIDIIIRKQD